MQDSDTKVALADSIRGSDVALSFCAAAHFSNSAGGSTITRSNMLACCIPQYSAQFPRKTPSCRGSIHIVLVIPGIRSVLPASCGTQKLCATSADSSFKDVVAGLAAVLSGTWTSLAVTIPRSG